MSNFKIASHDTMTYNKPHKWWMKLLKWTAKCQKKTWEEQLTSNAEMIDIRVRFDNTRAYFCHGIIEYRDANVYDILTDIEKYLATKNRFIYVRLILETSKENIEQEEEFKIFCEWVKELKHMKFFGGMRKFDWKVVYKFDNEYQDIDEKIGSVTGCLLFMVWPWLYAKLYNKKILEKGTTHEYLMIDFI